MGSWSDDRICCITPGWMCQVFYIWSLRKWQKYISADARVQSVVSSMMVLVVSNFALDFFLQNRVDRLFRIIIIVVVVVVIRWCWFVLRCHAVWAWRGSGRCCSWPAFSSSTLRSSGLISCRWRSSGVTTGVTTIVWGRLSSTSGAFLVGRVVNVKAEAVTGRRPVKAQCVSRLST